MILKEVTIEDRASVFEENPFHFNQRHHVVSGRSPPRGYRATWAQRGLLASAKLHAKLTPGVDPAEFASILMEPRRMKPDCDFVEVHIFGPLHRASIERVIGPEPPHDPDRLIWRQTARKLIQQGTQVDKLP